MEFLYTQQHTADVTPEFWDRCNAARVLKCLLAKANGSWYPMLANGTLPCSETLSMPTDSAAERELLAGGGMLHVQGTLVRRAW